MTILSPIERAVLRALSDACDCSIGAHVPREAVARKLQPNLRGEVKKQLKKLRAKGYCNEHPTGGNMATNSSWFSRKQEDVMTPSLCFDFYWFDLGRSNIFLISWSILHLCF